MTAIDPAFPPAVKAEIERALDTNLTSIVRQASGIGGRCYLIGSESAHWIARIDDRSAPRLQKSLLAQKATASAGVRVPGIVATQVEVTASSACSWIVEEYVRASEFYPERMDPRLRKPISADIGRQLKLLHTVELNGFGSLTRDLQDAPHPTWAAWVDEQQASAAHALRIAACGRPEIRRIENAYRTLRHGYLESPRLCHGDFADDNLLVEAGALIVVLDWESALAGDPASDVAYWFMWHEDSECLDGLLSGYAPADPLGFRQRVAAHRVLAAVKFICWFTERQDQGGVEHCRRILSGPSGYL